MSTKRNKQRVFWKETFFECFDETKRLAKAHTTNLYPHNNNSKVMHWTIGTVF